MIASAAAFLLGAQNRDGGWPTYEGRGSNTEATSFATLALARLDGAAERAAAERGIRWLVACQHADGSWPISPRISNSSWTTALAALTLAALEVERTAAVRGARSLLRLQPRRPGVLASALHRLAPDASPVKLDPHLRGWPWTPAAASFVEPTAYALLALKKLREHLPGAAVTARIDEAEQMIYDRTCRDGGWNYGNSTVLGVGLWAYADVTALTLLALADHRGRQDNQHGLAALHRLVAHVDSGLTLAWAALCFAAYDRDGAGLRARLQRAWQRTGFLGDVKSIGLALLAMSDGAGLVTP